MSNQHQKHLLEVKALVDTQPASKRIELYRWLASVADDSWTTKQLLSIAQDLEIVEVSSQQFDLQLSQRDGHHKKGDGK